MTSVILLSMVVVVVVGILVIIIIVVILRMLILIIHYIRPDHAAKSLCQHRPMLSQSHVMLQACSESCSRMVPWRSLFLLPGGIESPVG